MGAFTAGHRFMLGHARLLERRLFAACRDPGMARRDYCISAPKRGTSLVRVGGRPGFVPSAPAQEAPVCDWTDGERLTELRLHLTDTRRRMAATAVSIALTEDLLADTLEQMASERPPDAERLRSKATHARLYAAKERDRAALYGYPAAEVTPVSGTDTGH